MDDTFASLGPTYAANVVAALEERAQQVGDEIRRLQAAAKTLQEQGSPDVKSELKYLTGHYNAYNKALFYWNKGVRPSLAPNGDWLIPSGSQGGAVIHRLSRQGGVWTCGPSCQATAFHWHGALVEALDRAWELGDLHDDAADFAPDAAIDEEPFLPTRTAAELGARLAQARAAIAELWA